VEAPWPERFLQPSPCNRFLWPELNRLRRGLAAGRSSTLAVESVRLVPCLGQGRGQGVGDGTH
jgi:hypothetical protein